MGTPDAMTIRWRTNVPTDSRVWLGPAPDALVPMFSDATLTTEHELRVTGLSPKARSYYAVGTSAEILSGGDTLTWFDTAPHPDSTTSTRVWVLGDSGLPGAPQDRVRDAYYAFPGAQGTNVWLMRCEA